MRNRPSSDQYEISRKPGKVHQFVIAGVLAMVTSGSVFLLVDYSGRAKNDRIESLESQREEMSETISNLQLERLSLQKDNVELGQIRWQADTTIKELRKMLEAQGEELADLDRELAFFRNILDVDGVNGDLLIRDFIFSPYANSGQFQYRVVLVRGKMSTTEAIGKLIVQIQSGDGAASETLTLSERPFKFRHFQHFEGKFPVPPKFLNGEMLVRAEPNNRKEKPSERRYRLVDGRLKQTEG